MHMQMSILMSSGVRAIIGSRRSSLPLIYSRFSSSPLTSSSPASGTVASRAAADVAGEDLLLEEEPPSAATVAAKAAVPSLLQPRVVVYDGVCHLCHEGVKWVIKADKHRKIKFCCLQSKAAEPYMRLCGVDREDVLRRFLFIEGLGSYHLGSTG
ncbi:uncharacterized protein LOC132287006 [Cornus florida]|uniref:uncharacterized protein LOC132287006 n=1 Tax=Cornus florida TaxID=4283 RepID=UPI00289AB02C|nr:uncharacterized protein LOC132287006 [Cornus florida]